MSVCLRNGAAMTAPYGTDASELQALAPCVVMGPGDIGCAHKPGESIALAEIDRAVVLFRKMAIAAASSGA